MMGRTVNAGETDLLSLMLGKRAWALIGTPAQQSRRKMNGIPASTPGATAMSYPGSPGRRLSHRLPLAKRHPLSRPDARRVDLIHYRLRRKCYMTVTYLGFVAGLLCLCAFSSPAMAQEKSGYFRTVQRDGRWWLVDPDGQPFLSKGVTTVSFVQDRIKATNVSPYEQTNKAKYGNEDAWRAAAASRLIGWGFNSLGIMVG